MPEDDTNVANSSLVRHSSPCCPAGRCLASRVLQSWLLSVAWVQDHNTCSGDICCCPVGVQSGVVGPARDAAKSEGGRVVEKLLQNRFSEGLKPPLG